MQAKGARRFDRSNPGRRSPHSYHIFNAQTDSGKQPALDPQTRVFHDGKPAYTGDFTALDMIGQRPTLSVWTPVEV
jgi:hypothetical protein